MPKWESVGSVWVEIPTDEDSGECFDRSLDDKERGQPIRSLGQWAVINRYTTRDTEMALIRVTFNDGEEGQARVKVMQGSFVDVYKVGGKENDVEWKNGPKRKDT